VPPGRACYVELIPKLIPKKGPRFVGETPDLCRRRTSEISGAYRPHPAPFFGNPRAVDAAQRRRWSLTFRTLPLISSSLQQPIVRKTARRGPAP
jgi:hypothetical protein